MGLVSPDLGLIFWMLLSFLIVLFVLKKYAWKPILKTLKNRENSIEDALKTAQNARDEFAQLQADSQKLIQETKEQRDEIIKEGKEVKEKIIEEARAAAKLDTERLIKSAKVEIEKQKLEALNEIKNKITLLSVDIAEKLLRQELAKDDKQMDMIENLLKDIKFS